MKTLFRQPARVRTARDVREMLGHPKKAAALAALLISIAPAFAAAQSGTAAPTIDRAALFKVVGSMYGIDPVLLAAIATVESDGSADAVSPKGAAGLMQLMPETARRFHVGDRFDPVESALGAARFIDFLRHQETIDGIGPSDLATILAAYNAGEGAVQRHHGIPPYPETRRYVDQVLLLYILGDLMRGSGPPPAPTVNLLARPVVAARTPTPSVAATGMPHRSAAASRKFVSAREADRSVLEELSRIRRKRQDIVAAHPQPNEGQVADGSGGSESSLARMQSGNPH